MELWMAALLFIALSGGFAALLCLSARNKNKSRNKTRLIVSTCALGVVLPALAIYIALTFVLVGGVSSGNLEASPSEDGSPSVSPGKSADSDILYWDGLDFGSNLTYAEEYEWQGDPDEHRDAAESAKLMFDDLKRCGYISGSGNMPYTMTLIDIEDIDGNECYVYRCENRQDFIALFAYRSGGTYMQARGGEWVQLDIGDGDDDAEYIREQARGVVESALDERVAELSASVGHGGEYTIRYLGSDTLHSGDLIWIFEVGFENFTGFFPQERYAVNADEVYVATPEGWAVFDGVFYPYNVGWDARWWGRFNSIEYVNYALVITDYIGTSFHFATNDDGLDEVSGVAMLDPDDPYSARCGEMVFTYNGVDTINITDGDQVETFFRPEN
jgi:hypothetical protein